MNIPLFHDQERIQELISKLCPEANEDSNIFNLFENNEILLVEAGGIGASKYGDIINKMAEFVQNYCINNKPSEYNSTVTLDNGHVIPSYSLSFFIPSEYTKEFQEFSNLKILVTCFMIYENDDINSIIHGSGKNVNSKPKYKFDKNGKLIGITIYISCYMINDKLIKYSFTNNFLHEFNHAIEDYGRAKSDSETTHNYLSKINYVDRIKLLKNSNDYIDNAMGGILYRLWIDSELNAAATSSYAYLDSVNSQRNNFRKDIQKSQSYMEYEYLKNKAIPIIEELDDIDKWQYYGQILGDKVTEENVKSYKSSFLRHTYYLLSKYFKQICKTAEYYYITHNK